MSDKFVLENQSIDELITETGKRKLMAKRIYKKHECAKRINQMIERGDNDDEHICKEVWRIFNEMGFTEKELRDCMFSRLKQEVIKLARSHEKTEGAHRSIYRCKDGQIDIYTTRDIEALKHIIQINRSKAGAYNTIANDAMCQLYRVNHNMENYQQVSLFEATQEAEVI